MNEMGIGHIQVVYVSIYEGEDLDISILNKEGDDGM